MIKYLIKVVDNAGVIEYQVKHKTDANHLPRGGEHFFMESPVELNNPIVSIDGEGKKTLIEDPIKELDRQVTEKYDLMLTDIYAEMYNVFDTESDISAMAFVATYEAMLKRPENYVDPELGFIDTTEVTTFANTKLQAADAYGVFRLKRRAQFTAEKAAILGSGV
jgi:hypothetical protein